MKVTVFPHRNFGYLVQYQSTQRHTPEYILHSNTVLILDLRTWRSWEQIPEPCPDDSNAFCCYRPSFLWGQGGGCDDRIKGLVFPEYVIEDAKRSRFDRRLIQLGNLAKWADWEGGHLAGSARVFLVQTFPPPNSRLITVGEPPGLTFTHRTYSDCFKEHSVCSMKCS